MIYKEFYILGTDWYIIVKKKDDRLCKLNFDNLIDILNDNLQ